MIRQKRLFGISLYIVLFVSLILGVSCAPVVPFIGKPDLPPNSIKYCNSAIGHIAGSKPWIQDGTCCCTPTDELMAQYQKDGFCIGLTKDDLIKLYHDNGIVLDVDHAGCNNMCDHGPHVVKGGKCMATPMPGTKNYEEVVTGVWLQAPEKK